MAGHRSGGDDPRRQPAAAPSPHHSPFERPCGRAQDQVLQLVHLVAHGAEPRLVDEAKIEAAQLGELALPDKMGLDQPRWMLRRGRGKRSGSGGRGRLAPPGRAETTARGQPPVQRGRHAAAARHAVASGGMLPTMIHVGPASRGHHVFGPQQRVVLLWQQLGRRKGASRQRRGGCGCHGMLAGPRAGSAAGHSRRPRPRDVPAGGPGSSLPTPDHWPAPAASRRGSAAEATKRQQRRVAGQAA
jgi:hypothetical protein